MKRTIRLTESELTRMITECVKSSIHSNSKKTLKEGVHRYKGFKCVNISKDPSFPSYQVISPEGEAIGSTLFPSEMKKMVDDYLAGNKMEETVSRYIDRMVHESMENRLRLQWYIPGEGNGLMFINRLEDVPRLIQKAQYWDVTRGGNSSEIENLVAWNGKGGFWDNVLNNPETNPEDKKRIESKRLKVFYGKSKPRF
jgi:hypothetical protein